MRDSDLKVFWHEQLGACNCHLQRQGLREEQILNGEEIEFCFSHMSLGGYETSRCKWGLKHLNYC